MFMLTWHQHGGSGLAITWADVLDLSLSDRNQLLEFVVRQRRHEASEIKRAAGTR